jgi:hypothetical protein
MRICECLVALTAGMDVPLTVGASASVPVDVPISPDGKLTHLVDQFSK